MSKITEAFKTKAFIPFITCGDPDLETTKAIIKEMHVPMKSLTMIFYGIILICNKPQ